MDIKEDKENNCFYYVDDNGKEYMMFDRNNKNVTTKEWMIKMLKSLPKTSHNKDYDSESEKDSTLQGEICPYCDEGVVRTHNETGYIENYPCDRCLGTGKLSHNQ